MKGVVITKYNECYFCKHSAKVAGSAHIKCTKPPKKLVFDRNGIKNGWVIFPNNYDPVWKLENCSNFSLEKNESVEMNKFNLEW